MVTRSGITMLITSAMISGTATINTTNQTMPKLGDPREPDYFQFRLTDGTEIEVTLTD